MATSQTVGPSSSGPGGAPPIGAPQLGGDEYITSLAPNDVLCGRGSGPNDHSGNIRFRQLVISRKAEYLSTNARQTKARIAQEIVDHVKAHMVPPGRFLKKVDNDDAIAAGFRRGEEVWTLVTEDVALEKAKQALRQNRDKHLVAAELAEAQAAAAARGEGVRMTGGGGMPPGVGGGIAKPQPRKPAPSPYGPPPTHAISPASSGGSMPYGAPPPPDSYGRGGDPYSRGGGDPYYGGGPQNVNYAGGPQSGNYGGGPQSGGYGGGPQSNSYGGGPQSNGYGGGPQSNGYGGGPQAGGYGGRPQSGGYGDGGGDYASMPPPPNAYAPGPPPPMTGSIPGSCPLPPPPPPHSMGPPHSSAPTDMGPPFDDGMHRSGGNGSSRQNRQNRQSLTVADLEKDFRSRAQLRQAARSQCQQQQQQGGGQGYGVDTLPSPTYSRPQCQPQSLPEDAEVVVQEPLSVAENEKTFEEGFPYALGGRGPSADSMPNVDPLPASRSQGAAGASMLKLSNRTMNFIEKAFDESTGTMQAKGGNGDGAGGGKATPTKSGAASSSAKGMAQRQRQYQMMGMGARSPAAGAGTVPEAVVSPRSGGNDANANANAKVDTSAAVTFADGAPEPGTMGPGEDLDRRRLSTMSDISAMSMSLSLSDMGMSKEFSKWTKTNEKGQVTEGGAAGQAGSGIGAIQEGKAEEEGSSSTIDKPPSSGATTGAGAAIAKPATPDRNTSIGSAEPRRISSIQRKPDSIEEFGMSSMSIMKGLGNMESSSTFSGMSVIMSEASDVEHSKDRIEGGTGRSGSLSG